MVDYTNRGIYTYAEASKLLKLSVAQIKGLVNGYKYKDKPQIPIIEKKTILYDDKEYLTFFDIIEIKFIKYFLDCGVKRKTIIEAYLKAKKELKKDNPFATRFTSDGKNIFADNHKILLDMHDEQLSFRDICLPSMIDGIDFEKDIPVRWRPYKQDLPDVLLDPSLKYGQPLVDTYNITTKTLYDAYKAENNNLSTVSEWYNVPIELIQQAVLFEKRLVE